MPRQVATEDATDDAALNTSPISVAYVSITPGLRPCVADDPCGTRWDRGKFQAKDRFKKYHTSAEDVPHDDKKHMTK